MFMIKVSLITPSLGCTVHGVDKLPTTQTNQTKVCTTLLSIRIIADIIAFKSRAHVNISPIASKQFKVIAKCKEWCCTDAVVASNVTIGRILFSMQTAERCSSANRRTLFPPYPSKEIRL